MKLDNPSDFDNLDPVDPVHARRMQQRRRMVLLGKNTAGYEEYTKQVPKHKRRPRSMKHPATPDHQKDIPNKRWQGLVKAWRRALHQYDPPDLIKAETTASKFRLAKKEQLQTKQALELAQAAKLGLLVDVAPERNELEVEDGSSPSCVITASSSMSLMDKWEQQAKDENSMGDEFEAMDSDDDLI